MDIVSIARLFAFVREAQENGQNHGQRVNAIQAWCGGQDGESWCCYFATMCLDILFQGKAPIKRLGACQDVYDVAKANAWVTSTPAVGDLFLYVNDQGHAHHIGIVTETSPLKGIAGNTSSDGISSNGDGVYEHAIKATVFVHWPRP